MATTVKIPLELVTVQINSANAYWTAKSGANIDQSYIAFVDSGEGVSFYWAYIPNNLAATPAWNLDLYHFADSGSGGNALVSVFAKAMSNSSTIDVATTVVSSAAVIAVNTFGTMTYSAVSGGNFDAVVAISATNYLFVKVNRHGGNAADTVNAIWDLAAPVLRCDIA